MKHCKNEIEKIVQFFQYKRIVTVAIFIALMTMAALRGLDHPTEWHGIRAYKDFSDGVLQQYKTEMDERLAIYENAEDGTAVKVKPLTYSPELVGFSNIVEDSTFWENTGRAAYYGLKSIEIEE